MSELDAAIDASVPIGFLLQKKDSYDDIDKTMELVQNQRKSRMGVEYVRWTKEEEDKLLHLVGVVGGKNWVEIARLMDNDRSAKACNHKYQDLMKMQAQNLPLEYTDMKDMSGEPSSLDENLAGGHVIDFNNSINLNNTSSRVLWTPEEDKMLLQFIAEHSNSQHIPWSKLDIPGRSRKACSNRWDYQLKCKFANLNVYKRPILDAEGNQTGEEFCLPQATFSSAEDMLLHVTDGMPPAVSGGVHDCLL